MQLSGRQIQCRPSPACLRSVRWFIFWIILRNGLSLSWFETDLRAMSSRFPATTDGRTIPGTLAGALPAIGFAWAMSGSLGML